MPTNSDSNGDLAETVVQLRVDQAVLENRVEAIEKRQDDTDGIFRWIILGLLAAIGVAFMQFVLAGGLDIQ